MSKAPSPDHPLLALIDLGHQARQATSRDELLFLLVNGSKNISPYRQSWCWRSSYGISHVSGVLVPERLSPFMQWALELSIHLEEKPGSDLRSMSLADVPQVLQEGYTRWMPARFWWMRLNLGADGPGGLLVANDVLDEDRLALWGEWLSIWAHAWDRLRLLERRSIFIRATDWFKRPANLSLSWRHSPMMWGALALTVVLLVPVRLTIVGPGELVPREPVVVRAPLDGLIHEFHVSPNQVVKVGDALFSYDNDVVRSRLLVAQQSLLATQTEYRQTAQTALNDIRARLQIASLVGKVQEKQAELQFLTEQVNRTTVTAPQAGMVLFDEVSEWIGRPVQTGERVIRMASPEDVEVEVWVSLADAVPLKAGDEVKLFLAASPLDALEAKVRWISYEAQPRPDGTFAYRMRASLIEKSTFMVGVKGTARVSAGRVPLGYFLLRKPLAVARGYLLL